MSVRNFQLHLPYVHINELKAPIMSKIMELEITIRRYLAAKKKIILKNLQSVQKPTKPLKQVKYSQYH